MVKCRKCGKTSENEKPLCLKCYRENKKPKGKVDTEKETEVTTAISKKAKATSKDNSWVYNLIKGRIAETIIEELFLSLGFQVFKYGMENTIPGIMELLKGVKDEVAMEIKRMPDLVVYKDGRANFIEVKFRASESFKLKDIDKNDDYPYQNALIVVVSKKRIKCISFLELIDGKEITPTCKNYLGSRKEFDTDKDKIIEYCEYAVKFFENV